MAPQNCGSSNVGNFVTPLRESQDKKPFECSPRKEVQNILYGGRWWLPPSSGRGESCESKVAHGLSSTPLYPFHVLQTREHASPPCFSVVFYLGFTFESFKELGARQNMVSTISIIAKQHLINIVFPLTYLTWIVKWRNPGRCDDGRIQIRQVSRRTIFGVISNCASISSLQLQHT
jgi:hypothetical protein